MIPEYPKFKSLDPEDLDKLKTDSPVCEFAPANLIIWKDFDHPRITRINQNFCIHITPPNEPPFFFETIGKNKIDETIQTCLDHCGKISRATESFVEKIHHQQYKISCLRNHFDYLYETKVLAELKGRKYDGKRNHIKNFKRRHPDYEYIPLTPEFKKDCFELFEEWFAIRKESRYFPRLAHNSQKTAIEKAFKYYKELSFVGGALLTNNKIKGFIMGSPLNRETASVHFQYGHPSLRGIFQILLWEACNKTFAKFKYVNLEQDLGIPGIRKAKLSYYPLKLEKKFEITQKQPKAA